METAVVTGVFTLGGVAVGGGLEWARSSLALRRAAAGQRDELVVALDAACISLMNEAQTLRSLETRGSRLRQIGFGLLETGPPSSPSPASVTDIAYAMVQWLGAGAARGLRHTTPVAVLEDLRRTLWPLRSEIVVMGVRLSMAGDEGIKDATIRVTDAAVALLEHIDECERDYKRRGEELRSAIGQLRRARDAAAAQWWQRRKMRRRISGG
jgi:hypothetical protein